MIKYKSGHFCVWTLIKQLKVKFLKEVVVLTLSSLWFQGCAGRESRPHGHPGQAHQVLWWRRTAMTGRYHIFSKPMEGDSVAVAVLNTHSFGYPSNVSFTLAEVSYMEHCVE